MRHIPAHELAVRHGTTEEVIHNDMRWVRDNWWRADHDIAGEEAREIVQHRIRNLEYVICVAYEAFELSTKPSDTSTEDKPCPTCHGIAMDCERCEGLGVVKGTTKANKKTKGGDPGFLRVILDCNKEIARLQGLGGKDAAVVYAQVNVGVQERDAEAVDGDLLIQVMAAHDALERGPTPLLDGKTGEPVED